MKKRLIWFAIIVVLMTCAILVVVSPAVRNLVRDWGIYAWARKNLYGFYEALRYGSRRFAYVSIIFIALFALIFFVLLRVPAVNEKTIEPQPVTQKAVVKAEEGKTPVVVIEENKGGK